MKILPLISSLHVHCMSTLYRRLRLSPCTPSNYARVLFGSKYWDKVSENFRSSTDFVRCAKARLKCSSADSQTSRSRSRSSVVNTAFPSRKTTFNRNAAVDTILWQNSWSPLRVALQINFCLWSIIFSINFAVLFTLPEEWEHWNSWRYRNEHTA